MPTPIPSFQSTPPVQGATLTVFPVSRKSDYFNPRPLCRGRPKSCLMHHRMQHNFNPRPLCRGRQFEGALTEKHGIFQSTPPVQGATETARQELFCCRISIHAPCAGGDHGCDQRGQGLEGISIHAPCAGGDLCCTVIQAVIQYFNPRPLCRGRPDTVSMMW